MAPIPPSQTNMNPFLSLVLALGCANTILVYFPAQQTGQTAKCHTMQMLESERWGKEKQ